MTPSADQSVGPLKALELLTRGAESVAGSVGEQLLELAVRQALLAGVGEQEADDSGIAVEATVRE